MPMAMARGKFLLGSRTSPAIKVTSCQASAENSDPDCATHSATIRPNTLPAATPKDASNAPSAKKFGPKFAWIASRFAPIKIPAMINPARAATFAEVKTFWTILP